MTYLQTVICRPLNPGPTTPERVAFTRMYMTPAKVDKDTLAFTRLQLPFRLAYAMTVNKSQGQVKSRTGLYDFLKKKT